MSVTIAPVSQATAALPARATAGERLMMDGGDAPLRDIIQNLYDRTEYAKDVSQGELCWSGDLSVAPGGSLTSFTVNIGAIGAIAVNDGTKWKALSAAAGTATEANIEGGGGTLGASARWWYVYAYNNAGTVAYELSLTAPSGSRRIKNGDGSRRYLGCFVTTSAGAPVPMRAVRGRVTYLQTVPGGVTIGASSSSGYESLSVAALVPPHARVAILNVSLYGSATFRSIGDGGGSGASVTNQSVVLDASQAFEWNDGGTGSISVGVRGYEE